MKFGGRAIALAIAIAAVAAGCSSSPTSGPAAGASPSGIIPLLKIGTNFPVTTLNPITGGGNAWAINELSLETLMNIGPKNKLIPNLAESVSEPNPQTYVYHLRHGVTFWDGDPLTASDVVFSWDQYRAPNSTYASNFANVKDITADGQDTVVVTLTQPDAAWPYEPAEIPGVFEKKYYEAHKASFGNAGTLLMGTGPWKVDSFDETKGAVLSANPHWWGGKVPIQKISVAVFATETSMALAMRAGEIDLDPYVLDTTSFAKASGATMLSAPTDTAAVLSMNTKVAPWDDIHVRRAAAYAMNRADIIAAAGGFNSPMYTFFPPAYLQQMVPSSQVAALINSLPLYRYNVAKAKAELAQSAYHGASVTLEEYTYGSSVDISQVVAAELKKVGINAQVKVPSNSAWEAAMVGPNLQRPTDFATGYCGGPDISSCDTALGSWNLKPGQSNSANWAPPAVDSLLKTGLTTGSPTQRFALYSKILRAIQADVPYVGLFSEGVSIALSSKFTFPHYSSSPELNELDDYALGIRATG
jgi:peptide/nickel transport system substrate-binding protein